MRQVKDRKISPLPNLKSKENKDFSLGFNVAIVVLKINAVLCVERKARCPGIYICIAKVICFVRHFVKRISIHTAQIIVHRKVCKYSMATDRDNCQRKELEVIYQSRYHPHRGMNITPKIFICFPSHIISRMRFSPLYLGLGCILCLKSPKI